MLNPNSIQIDCVERNDDTGKLNVLPSIECSTQQEADELLNTYSKHYPNSGVFLNHKCVQTGAIKSHHVRAFERLFTNF